MEPTRREPEISLNSTKIMEPVMNITDPALSIVHQADQGFDILQFRFHDAAEVAKLERKLSSAGLPASQRSQIMEGLRNQQRLLRVKPDPNLATAMTRRGLRSANHIAKMPLQEFIGEHADALGLSLDQAREVHASATAVRNKSFQLWASIAGTLAAPSFAGAPFNNVNPALIESFQNLPSYQELFGTLDYCGCEECRSIFGAAAYLVDLLGIIEQYITLPNAATIPQPPGYPLNLSFTARRPDIGDIPLTCAMTNDMVSALLIANERLVATAKSLLDLSSVDEVIQAMATTLVYPQSLPFNAPLAEIQSLLPTLDSSYAAILRAWQWEPATPTVINIAGYRFGLSPETFAIDTTANATAESVQGFYNVTDWNSLKQYAIFMDKARLTFAELLTLLNQDLDQDEQTAGLQVNFFINQGLSPNWLYLAGDTITNLNLTALDQINRMLRLSATLERTIQDIDWALRCIQAGGTPVISASAITDLDQLIGISSRLGLDLQAATALLGPIKTYGQGADELGSPFDVLFNSPPVILHSGVYHPSGNPLNPSYQDTPLPWKPGSTAAADIAAINRVLPGLGLSLTHANMLGAFLFGTTTATNLDVAALSAMFRHALLSARLGLPIPQYLILLKIVLLDGNLPEAASTGAASVALLNAEPSPTSLAALTLSDIAALIAANDWLNQSKVSVFQLEYILDGILTVFVNPLYVPANVDSWLAALVIQVSPESPTVETDIYTQVATLFSSSTSLIQTVMPMAIAAVALPSGVTEWYDAFLAVNSTTGAPLYPDYVKDVLHWNSRWLVIGQLLSLPETNLANIAAYPLAYLLSPTSFQPITLAAVQSMWQVAQMMTRFGDLQQKLLLFIAQVTTTNASAPVKSPWTQDDLLLLQDATNWNASVVAQLVTSPIQITAHPLPVLLLQIEACMGILATLGADPAYIATLVDLAGLPASGNMATYTEAASALVQRAASLYGTSWATIWPTLSGDLGAALRDVLLALVRSLLNDADPTIRTDLNVYEYMLTNVNTGPATLTSYIQEAISAAQLYLQRCRLRLEPGVYNLSGIKEPWWAWLMNYRLWQANRMIFVYPENYLIPTLRSSVTPEFAVLKQNLQQLQITEASVEGAYYQYMNEFAVTAETRVVDAHRAEIGGISTLHLLGRTQTSPYTFFYCTQEQSLPWSAWQKIDITINSPTATLVYAFNRLFILWAEIQTNNSSTVSSTSGTSAVTTNNLSTTTLSLMYSFLNIDGKWVQPQTLVDQDVVYFNAQNDVATNPSTALNFDGLFNISEPVWYKVFAFTVQKDNYAPPKNNALSAERLVVSYGPDMNLTGNIQSTLTQSSYATDPTAGNFWNNLNDQLENYKRVLISQLAGNLGLQPVPVLNFNLGRDVLVKTEEFVLMDALPYAPDLKSLRMTVQTSENSILASLSAQPLTDAKRLVLPGGSTVSSTPLPLSATSFIGDGITRTQSQTIFSNLQNATVISQGGFVSSTALATLNLYQTLIVSPKTAVAPPFGPTQFLAILQILYNNVAARRLFSNVEPRQTSMQQVGSQPGWYVLTIENEIFLLTPTGGDDAFSSLRQGLLTAQPLVEPTFAIMSYTVTGTPGSITAANSAACYTQLVTDAIVLNGILTTNDPTTIANSLMKLVPGTITQAQVPYVINAVLNAPILFKNAFVSDTINSTASENLYAYLQTTGVIDPNGRLDQSGAVTYQNLLGWLNTYSTTSGTTFTQNQTATIYSTLLIAIIPASVTYTNTGSFAGLSSLKFDVTRLSTNAIDKLRRALFVGGVPNMLRLSNQQVPVVPVFPFDRFVPSTEALVWPSAIDATQVDFDGLYGQYFWEVFYHIPMLIAYTLNTHQEFETAQRWLQYVFDPTRKEEFVTPTLIQEETALSLEPITYSLAVSTITELQKVTVPPMQILDGQGMVNQQFTSTTDINFLMGKPELNAQQLEDVRTLLLTSKANGTAVTVEALMTAGLPQWQAQEVLISLLAPVKPILLGLDVSNSRVNPKYDRETDLSFLKSNPGLSQYQVDMVRNILLNYLMNAPASHFWQFQPFRNYYQESLQYMLSDSNPAVQVYKDHPFDPFAIARLRIGAYEKWTFMMYVDNLINWGDQLFTANTRESIAAAYMIYVYASNLLGPRPQQLGECPGANTVLTYNQIQAKYPNGIPDFLIDLELFSTGDSSPTISVMDHAFNNLYVYFCVPENNLLMSRWDTVADRITKINLSQNIDGVFQQLPLFAPPINPLDLVKAGGAIGSVLSSITTQPQIPYYRYTTLGSIAYNLCTVVVELGGSLLSALEKQDAEALALLRNTQEGQVQQMLLQVKQDRVSELQATLSSLNATLGAAENRVKFYTAVLDEGLSSYEVANIVASSLAMYFNVLAGVSRTAASIGYAVPQVGSPFAMTYGGQQLGAVLTAVSGAFEIGASVSTFAATMSATMGSYHRRDQDWKLQQQQAQSDVESITAQISSTQYALQGAQQDLAVQQTAIAQNAVIQEFLEDKFTNEQLYMWMAAQLSGVYFQTYELAMLAANQAQTAYQFELDSTQTFLNFNYFDNLRKGLMAGEGLRLALNRLDAAYRQGDMRRYEIEKTISLAQLQPDQLLALKTTGHCTIALTEAMFDYDYPGQYARKIKTVSVSIPVVVGPYQNIKATLTQKKNSVVMQPQIGAVNYLLNLTSEQPSPSVMRTDWAPKGGTSIAISRGADDSGMFVLDFNDPKYLPFENTGAVSEWELSMPIDTNYFDFEQLTDVILNVKYTALYDTILEGQVRQSLKQVPLQGGFYIAGRQQSAAWMTFLLNHSSTTTQPLLLNVPNVILGAYRGATITSIKLQLVLADGIAALSGNLLTITAGTQSAPAAFTQNGADLTVDWVSADLPPTWTLAFNLSEVGTLLGADGFIDGAKLLDVQMIVEFQAFVFGS